MTEKKELQMTKLLESLTNIAFLVGLVSIALFVIILPMVLLNFEWWLLPFHISWASIILGFLMKIVRNGIIDSSSKDGHKRIRRKTNKEGE